MKKQGLRINADVFLKVFFCLFTYFGYQITLQLESQAVVSQSVLVLITEFEPSGRGVGELSLQPMD